MKKLIILYLLIAAFSMTFAQNKMQRSGAYFSGNLSAYHSNDSQTLTRDGSTRIGGGIGFGFNIIDNLFFYSKATYVSRANFTGYYDASYLNSDLQVVNNIGTANASFSQLIVNGGLQYNIYITDAFTLGLLGGMTYTIVDQEARTVTGELLQQIDNQGFYGYFGGASMEKYFKDSNFTLFAEVIYNYIRDDSIYFHNVFSGMNFTIGGRYYFAGKF